MSAAASRSTQLARLAILAVLVVAPFVGVYPVFVMKALCFAIFACAFNLLLGFTGLLSFGHAAFMGSAAYATGWLVRSGGLSPELGLVAGVLLAAALGLAGAADSSPTRASPPDDQPRACRRSPTWPSQLGRGRHRSGSDRAP